MGVIFRCNGETGVKHSSTTHGWRARARGRKSIVYDTIINGRTEFARWKTHARALIASNF